MKRMLTGLVWLLCCTGTGLAEEGLIEGTAAGVDYRVVGEERLVTITLDIRKSGLRVNAKLDDAAQQVRATSSAALNADDVACLHALGENLGTPKNDLEDALGAFLGMIYSFQAGDRIELR
jgi:hypothetical protein